VSAWERLVRAALLGTERQAASEEAEMNDPALDAAVAALADRPAEARVLGTAALLDAWRRAGRRPSRSDVPAAPPAPEAEERVCGDHAAVMLRQVLAGGPPSLVAEWMALAEKAGVAIPHELLPPVLDSGARHAAVRDAIADALGPRGRWLAALNPAWAYATGVAPDPAGGWETATAEERARILRDLRASDPAAGLALLRTTWATDPSRDRAAFLDALSVGLGMDDESFLESALDDKRKEVRTAAARLLGTLPESRLVGRTTERLAPLLRVHVPDGMIARLRGQGPRIDVELPVACDKAMQRDGIEPKPPYGTGERTWWLQQMIAAVPPSVWSAAWGMDAAACIQAARAGGEPGTLVRAWTQATVRAGDAAWAEALLRAGADVSEHLLAQELLATVPPHRLEAVALERLGLIKQLQGGSAVSRILESARVSWSPALTRAVLLALPPALEPSDWSLREMLRLSANHMHPVTGVAVLRERGDPYEGAWVDLIHLRATLHQAFR
jgi:hypothetical protein